MTFKLKLFLLVLCIPSIAISQSLGYSDADSPGEAVGMLKVSIHVAAVMRRECVARFPDMQNRIDTDLLKWKTTETPVLKKAEFHWSAMTLKQPNLSETLTYAEKAMIQNIETVSQAPGGAGKEVLSQYCTKHFSDLAAGVWRQRTPRAYAYLSSAN